MGKKYRQSIQSEVPLGFFQASDVRWEPIVSICWTNVLHFRYFPFWKQSPVQIVSSVYSERSSSRFLSSILSTCWTNCLPSSESNRVHRSHSCGRAFMIHVLALPDMHFRFEEYLHFVKCTIGLMWTNCLRY